jgi:glutathione synthase
MGGKSIFVINHNDGNANVIIETLTDYGSRFAMAQIHIPEISQGDKRILLIDGKPIPYALQEYHLQMTIEAIWSWVRLVKEES